jgi:hypothetical protein
MDVFSCDIWQRKNERDKNSLGLSLLNLISPPSFSLWNLQEDNNTIKALQKSI